MAGATARQRAVLDSVAVDEIEENAEINEFSRKIAEFDDSVWAVEATTPS